MANRIVKFYKTADGKCPVEEFLDSLPGKAVQKVTWVLKLLEDLDVVAGNRKSRSLSKRLFEKEIDHERPGKIYGG